MYNIVMIKVYNAEFSLTQQRDWEGFWVDDNLAPHKWFADDCAMITLVSTPNTMTAVAHLLHCDGV